jgi:hypothetical protein
MLPSSGKGMKLTLLGPIDEDNLDSLEGKQYTSVTKP